MTENDYRLYRKLTGVNETAGRQACSYTDRQDSGDKPDDNSADLLTLHDVDLSPRLRHSDVAMATHQQ